MVQSAPTDTETTTPMSQAESTPIAPKETQPTTTTQASSSSTQSSSLPVSSAQDLMSNTSFTCYNRKLGYYADIDSACKIYHFCILGDYNGQQIYQRISYLCLNNTIFDQQILDCVEQSKMSAPCAEAVKYYDESNLILRKATIGKPAMENEGQEAKESGATESISPSTSSTSAAPETSASS